MAEMPIDPEYNRFIDPIENQDTNSLEGDEALINIFDADEESDVEELPDGSAIVRLDDMKGPEENPDFYANMAESMDTYDLQALAIKYLDLIDKDKEAREERDKQY